jgi:hypothetical protein
MSSGDSGAPHCSQASPAEAPSAEAFDQGSGSATGRVRGCGTIERTPGADEVTARPHSPQNIASGGSSVAQ